MTVGRTEPEANLADLLASDRLALLAGAHDALSARLASKYGFDAIWVSSFGVTNALGLVDEGVITLTEMLEVAWRIRNSVSCPVVVDCDTGYGDVTNVRRLGKEAARRGIDAICLEDQAMPKRNTFLEGEHRLEDADLFSKKISAAVQGCGQGDCLVIARTEALAQGGSVAEALDRAWRYIAAGAQAIVIQPRQPDLLALQSFAAAWRGSRPLGLLATSVRQVGFAEMARVGFNFAIYANQGLRASVRATGETYGKIIGGGGRQPDDLALASMEEILKLQSESEWS